MKKNMQGNRENAREFYTNSLTMESGKKVAESQYLC